MNLESFYKIYAPTASETLMEAQSPSGLSDPDFDEIIQNLGGKTFNGGLYRVLRSDQLESAREILEQMYPKLAGALAPFGYDWLGRHFAVDNTSLRNGQPSILMLEIGGGDAFVIPSRIADFHNVDLVESQQEALAYDAWKEWKEEHPEDLAHSQCVGYRRPLFLGGKDDETNFEVVDREVYLSFCAQLWIQVRDLPEGTPIGKIQWG